MSDELKRKFIITRTVEITLEVEASDPKEAIEIYYENEFEGEYDEQTVEMWDVTDDDNHKRVSNREFEDR